MNKVCLKAIGNIDIVKWAGNSNSVQPSLLALAVTNTHLFEFSSGFYNFFKKGQTVTSILKKFQKVSESKIYSSTGS